MASRSLYGVGKGKWCTWKMPCASTAVPSAAAAKNESFIVVVYGGFSCDMMTSVYCYCPGLIRRRVEETLSPSTFSSDSDALLVFFLSWRSSPAPVRPGLVTTAPRPVISPLIIPHIEAVRAAAAGVHHDGAPRPVFSNSELQRLE